MAEDTTVQQEGQEAPAESPASLDSDAIRQMVEAEAQRIVDARIPGLQSAYEKQLAQMRKELKKAQSGEDTGYATYESDEYQRELEQARKEAAALRAGRQYPDAFPIYESLMAADSVEDQLELLQEFVRGTPAPTTPQQAAPAAPAEPKTRPVDQNNPPSSPPPPVDGPSTLEGAYSIIDAIGDTWPRM